MAVCSSPRCDARILWVKLQPKLKAAPLDPEPVPNGNVVRVQGDIYRVLTKLEIQALDNPGMLDGPPPDRYTLHWSTCPDAPHFRRCGTCHKSPCVCKKEKS